MRRAFSGLKINGLRRKAHELIVSIEPVSLPLLTRGQQPCRVLWKTPGVQSRSFARIGQKTPHNIKGAAILRDLIFRCGPERRH